jgi:hypothetical protein
VLDLIEHGVVPPGSSVISPVFCEEGYSVFKPIASAAILALGVMAGSANAQTPAPSCPAGSAPAVQTTIHQGCVGAGPVRACYTYTQTQQSCQPIPTPTPTPTPKPR